MAQEWLDFYDIFVNEVSGTVAIFMVLSVIIILVFAVRWKFNNLTIFALLTLWFVIMSSIITTLLPLVLALLGFFIGSQINRLVTR